MDVQRGHCWRCEKALPDPSVRCDDCPLAVYCTTSCKDRDRVRHKAVECQVFGRKKCNTCGNNANTKECAICLSALYCNTECQKKDWSHHKDFCKLIQTSTGKLAKRKAKQNHSIESLQLYGSPMYFGNIFAKDFLQLENNEWFEKEQLAKDLCKDYHVLSAGCGDLRNTVLTAGSLPDRYQGKLHITLDDIDPFVMARNVLFLYMLVRFADSEGIESSLTTIWYSLHITKKEYDLIKTSLEELIQMKPEGGLYEITKELITVSKDDFMHLRPVWQNWGSLECQRGKRKSINLRQQRKQILENKPDLMTKSLPLYFVFLSEEDKVMMEAWFDHGLFLPSETDQTDMQFDNPTLTGRCPLVRSTPGDLKKMVDTFVYCIGGDMTPFIAWDSLRVRESISEPYSSPMVMYHRYVTKILKKCKSVIDQGKLRVYISLAPCTDFPDHHQRLLMSKYDRIFTSNLADYVGVAVLLKKFKQLLNCSNSFSVIVTEFSSWGIKTPGADVSQLDRSSEKFIESLNAFKEDNQLTVQKYTDLKYKFDHHSCISDYYNNITIFRMYLQAEIMAGGIGIPPLKDVPSWNEVMKYNGMQMRNFCKNLNRLVPFRYRVKARDLTMLNGDDRTVEWYLPQEYV